MVKDVVKKENWPELVALTSLFSVELPGIETDALPGILDSEQQFRYASFPFSPARYQRLCFRVLTTSTLTIYCSGSQDSSGL